MPAESQEDRLREEHGEAESSPVESPDFNRDINMEPVPNPFEDELQDDASKHVLLPLEHAPEESPVTLA